MSRAVKALIVVAGLSGGVVGMSGRVHGQAAASTQNLAFPVAIAAFVPCANDGAGEVVQLSGNLHMVTHTIANASGITVKSQIQPQGISGVGMDSGDRYQGTGVTQSTMSSSDPGADLTYSYVNNFRVIGHGAGNNLLVHETLHVTVNAQGALTASVDTFKVACR
jgi:hypothetical protein